ncbi:MAG: hypothetical protein JWQ35_234 [Bacteriovoracaceae bacterium]|nr:hypothetical protein [Bacteriovoracaceae bacterium]
MTLYLYSAFMTIFGGNIFFLLIAYVVLLGIPFVLYAFFGEKDDSYRSVIKKRPSLLWRASSFFL